MCHIINRSLNEGVCPQESKTAKIITLLKNRKVPFSGQNSRLISLLPVLSKIMEHIVYEQINSYFSVYNLTTDFQHVYRVGHSTATALMQMTDDCLKEIEDKK